MRKSAFFLLFVLLSFTTFSSAIEPQHEYEKPGYNPGHAYDGIVPEESIDLFSGALNISHRDVALPNYSAFDSVLPLLIRSYSSKIYRQGIPSGVCLPRAIRTEEDYIGLGWSLHFGRLHGTSTGFVLELPDGSSHIMVNDTNKPAGVPNSFPPALRNASVRMDRLRRSPLFQPYTDTCWFRSLMGHQYSQGFHSHHKQK